MNVEEGEKNQAGRNTEEACHYSPLPRKYSFLLLYYAKHTTDMTVFITDTRLFLKSNQRPFII